MISTSIGNAIYQRLSASKAAFFDLGEVTQLSYYAFQIARNSVETAEVDPITITYPIGYTPTRVTIDGKRILSKSELVERYDYLGNRQLASNSILHLVTICEAMLEDLLRIVIAKYPAKLGSKKQIPIQMILECPSIGDLHAKAIDHLINELAYKSPAEFAQTFAQFTPVNLLECPSFHRYIEIKASRDIIIHNRGIANEIYTTKAGSHARTKAGHLLPLDTVYFLESYEICLQLAEWLQERLHEHWHSSEFEEFKSISPSNNDTPPPV